jgi:hypothetical protein
LGKQAFARLKKAGFNTDQAIKKMGLARLMSVAGIGPVKAGKLFRALGVKVKQSEVERTYARLNRRTQFKKVKAAFKKLAEDPRPQIDRLERTRRELIGWQNLLANVRNVGRPESERVSPLSYAPVSTTLDPFSIELGTTTGDRIYGEVFVIAEETRARIKYEARNLTNGEILITENAFVENTNTVLMITEIGDVIEDIYKRFRKRTLTGMFFIILDREYVRLQFYDALRERFRREIDAEKIIMKETVEEYYDWEALFKYQGNDIFERMVDRLDLYHSYLLYDEYVKEGGKKSYEDWYAEEGKDNLEYFWNYMADANKSSQQSNQPISVGNGRARFGILKGMPGMVDYDREWMRESLSIPFVRDTGYEDYKNLKAEFPLQLRNEKIPATVAAMVHAVLDNFTVYKSKKDRRIAFRSEKLPEIGILWEPR